MKVSCGTDIIEIERIKSAIEREKDHFINQIYTKAEIEYCESKNANKYQHYAVRFAAKEAIFKAVSVLLKDKFEISWQNAEILHDDMQNPKVNFIGIEFDMIDSMDVTMSHCKEYATATVVILYE